jgi:nucleotide-binding universal stress UspA family protein
MARYLRYQASWQGELASSGTNRERRAVNYEARSAIAPMISVERPRIMSSTLFRLVRRAGMERILIAVDGSPSTCEAVEFGVQLAVEQDAAVTLVHVVAPLDVIPMTAFGMGAGVRPHQASEDDRHSLTEAIAVAKQHGVRASAKLLTGDAVDEIVACADNLDVDVIVIGSRGHGTLTSALLGSVSRGVLSESRRPVAIVRGLDRVPVPAKQRAERRAETAATFLR